MKLPAARTSFVAAVDVVDRHDNRVLFVVTADFITAAKN